ncbi:MAG: DUF4230 domain-containing protein [Salegentibacter sp.]
MRNLLLGVCLTLLIVFGFRYCERKNEEQDQLKADTSLLQEQIKNVGKLVVTEGTFSQVYSYKDSRQFYFDIFSARKKALIVVNAKATVAYDLRKLEVEVNPELKTVNITHIPKEEINIYPDISYYDVTQDYLNQFKAEDYNKIRSRIDKSLRRKIENSDLKSNAQNRLISELQKFYILTSSMGWTLEYKSHPVQDEQALDKLKL